MKRFRNIILLIVLSLVVTVAAFAFSYHLRRERLVDNFAKIQEGDARERVVQVLGQPEEVEQCYGSDPSGDATKRCVEIFWYKSFLERWGVSFNNDSKVIYKTYNVLF